MCWKAVPQLHFLGEEPRKMKMEEAVYYLQKIKFAYMHQPLIYHRFVDTLLDFTLDRIDVYTVVWRASQLLTEHPELIIELNKFLPSGYRINVYLDHRTHVADISVDNLSTSTTMRQHPV